MYCFNNQKEKAKMGPGKDMGQFKMVIEGMTEDNRMPGADEFNKLVIEGMTEDNRMPGADEFNKLMKESKDQLGSLRNELQNLMIRFGMRSLTLYQAARKEPLRLNEMNSIIKYELTSAIKDFSEPANMEDVINKTKTKWEEGKKST